MRSLYVRLLLGFLTVLALASAAMFNVYQTVTGPRVVQMVAGSQAAQAEEAVAAMRRGGTAEARNYLQQLDALTQIPHYLTDSRGRDVLSGEDRSAMLAPAPAPAPSGLSRPYQAGDRAVFVTPSRDGAHRLITMAPVPYQLSDLLPQFALITAAVVLAFWLLAADVARPLRRLANTVERFGRGDLAVRADVRRRDEIGGLARAFNDMAVRTESLVTAERRLLQDVSHELRSPLTRLNLAIELSRTAPDRQQAADRLQREATRLSDLVGTLLEVVRLEGEPGSTPTTPVGLMEIVQESVDNGAAEAERRNVRLCLTGDLPGLLMGNAELLRRAFDNIVGNAVRYAPPDSAVTLTCSATPTSYAIEVRDMGPGVRDDQIEKLGTALYRTDESRSSDTGGLGLGLAIARRSIHLHGGRVEFANAHPGLRVTVRLPQAES